MGVILRRFGKGSAGVKALLAGAVILAVLLSGMPAHALNKINNYTFATNANNWTSVSTGDGINGCGLSTSTSQTSFATSGTWAWENTGNPAGSWRATSFTANGGRYKGYIHQSVTFASAVKVKGSFQWAGNSSVWTVGDTDAFIRVDWFDSANTNLVQALNCVALPPAANNTWYTVKLPQVSLAAGTYTLRVTISYRNNASNPATMWVDNVNLNASPTGLAATANTERTVSLGWTTSTSPSGPALSGYNVHCGTVSGEYEKKNATLIGSGSTTYTVLNLEPSTTYYCVLTDLGTDNVASSYSAEVSRTTSAATTEPDIRGALIHNSTNTSAKYWAGNSGWGETGKKYGRFICITCHTPNTTNIKLIRTSISTPDSTNWASTGAKTAAVNFQTVTTPNGFGDDTSTHATSQKVCEVCHSQTTTHKYNQTAATHKNNTDCTTCHQHKTGFRRDGKCKECHNATQGTSPVRRQVVGGNVGAAGDDFKRSSRHVSNGTNTEIVTDFDCVICHREGSETYASNGTGYLNVNLHENGVVDLRNVDNVTAGWTWNRTAITAAMRNNMDQFCLSCHDSDGAIGISVNNSNPATGVVLNDVATIRAVVGAANANPNAVTVNLRPFNTSDNLRNAYDSAHGSPTIGTFRTSTYGRVLNVKDQFNTAGGTGVAGKAYASHHNLSGYTARYTTAVMTGWPTNLFQTYTTRQGKTLATEGEKALFNCSDCHLNEANTHGARNAWYMLLNDGPLSDADIVATGAAYNADSNITDKNSCFRCHKPSAYGYTGGTNTQGRTQSHQGCSRVDAAGEYPFANQCQACHGGFSSYEWGALGTIHGSNDQYFPKKGAISSSRYRFMSGAAMRFYNPNVGKAAYTGEADWALATGDTECYTINAADTWSNCTGHGTGTQTSGNTINRTRALTY